MLRVLPAAGQAAADPPAEDAAKVAELPPTGTPGLSAGWLPRRPR